MELHKSISGIVTIVLAVIFIVYYLYKNKVVLIYLLNPIVISILFMLLGKKFDKSLDNKQYTCCLLIIIIILLIWCILLYFRDCLIERSCKKDLYIFYVKSSVRFYEWILICITIVLLYDSFFGIAILTREELNKNLYVIGFFSFIIITIENFYNWIIIRKKIKRVNEK